MSVFCPVRRRTQHLPTPASLGQDVAQSGEELLPEVQLSTAARGATRSAADAACAALQRLLRKQPWPPARLDQLVTPQRATQPVRAWWWWWCVCGEREREGEGSRNMGSFHTSVKEFGSAKK